RRPHQRPPVLPYTTLFRSEAQNGVLRLDVWAELAPDLRPPIGLTLRVGDLLGDGPSGEIGQLQTGGVGAALPLEVDARVKLLAKAQKGTRLNSSHWPRAQT